MRRRLARPYGASLTTMRLMSLIMAIGVLGMLYQRVKDPSFWGWLATEGRADTTADVSEKPASKTDASNEKLVAASETIIPGPNEMDPDELIKLRSNLKAVTDRRPLEPYEMPAYWQFLKWSRTRSFAELEKTARRDLPYTQLWEQPDLYRGQSIRLKLHVRRVLKFEPKENPLGLTELFEAWGWTDESRSFPFVVVFPERPAGLPIGTDVDADIVFVGYFLKWMNYEAFDKKKNSPLLVGRARPVTRATVLAREAGGWESGVLTALVLAVALGLIGWIGFGAKRKPMLKTADGQPVPDQLPNDWLAKSSTELSLKNGTDGAVEIISPISPNQPRAVE